MKGGWKTARHAVPYDAAPLFSPIAGLGATAAPQKSAASEA
jgi:hypothetical protein